MRVAQANNVSNQQSNPGFKATFTKSSRRSIRNLAMVMPQPQRDAFFIRLDELVPQIQAIKDKSFEPEVGVFFDKDSRARVSAHLPGKAYVRGETVKFEPEDCKSGSDLADTLFSAIVQSSETIKESMSYAGFLTKDLLTKINKRTSL